MEFVGGFGRGLRVLPFEPLEGADLKPLSLKTVLLGLASAKQVALSVHLSCTQFSPGDGRMILKSNPAFVPKVIGSCLVSSGGVQFVLYALT